jgi:Galactose oxidase, central domain/Tyrosine-protein kinase ephrin type A/B receptor-like
MGVDSFSVLGSSSQKRARKHDRFRRYFYDIRRRKRKRILKRLLHVQYYYKLVDPARANGCMYYKYPVLYLYGGENSNGILDDLWKFSMETYTFNQINAQGNIPPSLKGFQCFIDFESSFLLYGGQIDNLNYNSNIYGYIPNEIKWSIVPIKSSYLELANPSIVVLNDSNILLIGGNSLTEAKFSITFVSGLILPINIGYLEIPMTSHKSCLSGNTIYLYGGETVIGNSVLKNVGSSGFYKFTIDSISCSEGTYGPNCSFCGPGYYNWASGSSSCLPCPKGTYSKGYGQSLYTQCIPCSEGTFNDVVGSSACKNCSSNTTCSVGSISPETKFQIDSIMTSEPGNYDSNVAETDQIILSIIISLSSASGFLTLLYLLPYNHRNFFKKFDLFKNVHERKYYEEPFATNLGGLFSLVFIMASVVFIAYPWVYYYLSNITETKSLVPAFIYQNQKIIADSMELEINLYGHGGVCGDNGTCRSTINTKVNNLTGNQSGPSCSQLGSICSVILTCLDCTSGSSSNLSISIVNNLVYASAIQVKVKTSTSIPDKNLSSVQFYITPPSGNVFNGLNPTIVYLKLIPSVTSI